MKNTASEQLGYDNLVECEILATSIRDKTANLVTHLEAGDNMGLTHELWVRGRRKWRAQDAGLRNTEALFPSELRLFYQFM